VAFGDDVVRRGSNDMAGFIVTVRDQRLADRPERAIR
jgi:hypothetical protein